MIIFLFSLLVLLVQCFDILNSITCDGTGNLALTVPDMCCQSVADGGFGGQGYVNDTSGDCSLCSKLISEAEWMWHGHGHMVLSWMWHAVMSYPFTLWMRTLASGAWTLETIGLNLPLHGNYTARLVWYTIVVCVHQSRVEGLHCLLDQCCRDSTHMSLGDCLVNFFSVLVFSNRKYIARLTQINVVIHRWTMMLIWGWLLGLGSPGLKCIYVIYIYNYALVNDLHSDVTHNITRLVRHKVAEKPFEWWRHIDWSGALQNNLFSEQANAKPLKSLMVMCLKGGSGTFLLKTCNTYSVTIIIMVSISVLHGMQN